MASKASANRPRLSRAVPEHLRLPATAGNGQSAVTVIARPWVAPLPAKPAGTGEPLPAWAVATLEGKARHADLTDSEYADLTAWRALLTGRVGRYAR